MQIKVENILTHTIVKSYGKHIRGFQVDKALVVEGKIFLKKYSDEEAHEEFQQSMHNANYCKSLGWFKPIIISETEEIRLGDWFLKDRIGIHQATEKDHLPSLNVDRNRFQKILAHPQHFSSWMVQDILDLNLIDGTKILVECEGDHVSHAKCRSTDKCQETEGFKGTEHEGLDMCEDGCVWGKPGTVVKLDERSHATLYQANDETTKYYTREEVKDIVYNALNSAGRFITEIGADGWVEVLDGEFNSWFDHNVK